ncbi:MAG TPA: hypothetical protein VIO64_16135 [Pseudobacteroides sp.]|uniref:hypothetical protein n=1 Tax=Pseudobacteroides sp. TaxID=1968840 RepID=UPI002F952AF2
MDKSLFNPTLKTNGVSETKSYDISKLFYVAFFGGVIPITVLGSRNARWLGVKSQKINLFYIIGIFILVSKAIFAALILSKTIHISSRDMRLGIRIADVVFYLFMYFTMKPKFYQHILNGGIVTPLLKDALKWIAIGVAIEIMLLIGGVFVAYALQQ